MTIINEGIVSDADDGLDYEYFDGWYDTYNSVRNGHEFASDKMMGFRFQGVAVPQGATISSATLTLDTDDASSVTNVGRIFGQDVDSAAAWANTTLLPKNMTRTTAFAALTGVPTTNGTAYPIDVTSIVQEIVDRAGWSSGNNMAFGGGVTGNTGARKFEDYGNVPADAAALEIDYVSSTPATANVTGVSGTGAAGTATATGDATVSLTGVSGTGAAGTVTASVDATTAITGVEGTGAAGTAAATGKATASVTGAGATGAAGTPTATGKATATPSGVEGTGSAGTAAATGDANTALTGVGATGAAGTVTAVAAGDAVVQIAGVSGTGQAGTVTATGAAAARRRGGYGGGRGFQERSRRNWDDLERIVEEIRTPAEAREVIEEAREVVDAQPVEIDTQTPRLLADMAAQVRAAERALVALQARLVELEIQDEEEVLLLVA